MKNHNYQKELEIAQYLAREAGKAILPIYYGEMDVSQKSDNTPVTNADILANRIIKEGLLKAFPLDGIVSEELDSVVGARYWYIDPIDGTRGFIEHNDQFAVHIGLAVDSQAVLGIVYKPVANEMYFAVKGQGAYASALELDITRKLAVQENPKLIASMDRDVALSKQYRDLAKQLDIVRTTISGSEGLRVMKVAEGVADVHFNTEPGNYGTWDICAPFLIAEEAGAYIRYTDGRPIRYFSQRKVGKTFVVANSKDLADRVSEYLEQK